MKKIIFKIFYSCALCMIPFSLGYTSQPKNSLHSSKATVLVSIAPYAYFVEKIAGNTINIEILVPPGANAHFFEPTPRQIEKVGTAQIWLRVGDSFEYKLAKILAEKKIPLMQLNLWEGMDLLPLEAHHHEHHVHETDQDLHLWLSPKRAKIQANKIALALISLYPENQKLYAANLVQFQNELDELDQKITQLLGTQKNHAIVVSHPSFGYFCHDYQLIQLSVECEGKDPRPKDIDRLLDQAKASDTKLVLAQAGFNNKGAEIIAKKLELPLYRVDPYSKNYASVLLQIAEWISQ